MELKSEKAFRIADLILRYQEETISEEEMEELRLWLKKSTEHQQQFENLNDRDYIRRKRELDLSINPAAAYTAFSERIARERPSLSARRTVSYQNFRPPDFKSECQPVKFSRFTTRTLSFFGISELFDQ